MLYYLFRYLGEFGVSGANLWHYISFRALLTLVLSLLISMWLGQYFIKWMKKHGGSEAQRDASIDPYGVGKKGVPTMGGVMIIVATVIPCLLLGRLRNIYMLLMLVTTIWLGALGFADDYITVLAESRCLAWTYIGTFVAVFAEFGQKILFNGIRNHDVLCGEQVLRTYCDNIELIGFFQIGV